MKQLLTIALVSATSAWCEAAETANQKAAKATTPCGELLFLTEATKKLTGQTTHNLNMAAELSKETRTYRLAGCRATNPKQKLKFVLLEAIAAARLHKALQAADNTAHSEAQAAQSLAARAVQLKSLIANGVNKTSYTAAASYGNKQSGIFSGTAETCTVHLSNTPTTELTCIGQLPDANDIKEAAADVMKETEMKMQPDEAFSTLKLTLTVAAKGTLSTGGNALTDNSGCTNNNDVAGPKASANNALGIHTVSGAAEPTAAQRVGIDPTNNNPGSCLQETQNRGEEKTILSAGVVAQAICRLKKLERTSVRSTCTETPATLSASTEAQEIAEMLQTGEIKAAGDGEKKKQMVQNILGTSDKTIYDELIQPLESDKPAYKISNTANTINLKTLGESDSYAAALAFCTNEARRTLVTSQAQQTTGATDSTKPEDCKEKTDKEKYNKKVSENIMKKIANAKKTPKKQFQKQKNTTTTGNNSVFDY
uniref:Variant surface glycoprotein 758 n=1 Tax=Trypanosoma brucei TaxID=5691 RepID=M4SZ18_9TRYP|nr:variant surface glycoprotein 758 [Trypanosoma brucei]